MKKVVGAVMFAGLIGIACTASASEIGQMKDEYAGEMGRMADDMSAQKEEARHEMNTTNDRMKSEVKVGKEKAKAKHKRTKTDAKAKAKAKKERVRAQSKHAAQHRFGVFAQRRRHMADGHGFRPGPEPGSAGRIGADMGAFDFTPESARAQVGVLQHLRHGPHHTGCGGRPLTSLPTLPSLNC